MNGPFEKIFESEEFREEFFVSQVQAKLAELLEDKGVSRAELARKLDVSRPRVTQIFSDDAKNLTLRLVFRSFAALEEEPVLLPKSEYMALLARCALNDVEPKEPEWRGGQDFSNAVIADTLRSIIGNVIQDSERAPRRIHGIDEWVNAGPNVVPIREKKRAG